VKFSSRANQTSDESGLKVDGNCIWLLTCLPLAEPSTFVVTVDNDGLWILQGP